MFRNENIFKDGQIAEKADILEGAGDAQLGDLVRGLHHRALIKPGVLPGVLGAHLPLGKILENGLPMEGDETVGGLVHPGDAVKSGGLPRPVGADEGHNLPLVHIQGEVIHRHHAAELHGDIFHMKHVFAHCCTSPFFFSLRF